MSSNQVCNIIGSKNLTDNSSKGVSYEWVADGWLHVYGTQDTESALGVTSTKTPIHLGAGEYVMSVEVEGGGLGTYAYVVAWTIDNSVRLGLANSANSHCALSVTEPVDIYICVSASGKGETVDYRIRIMLAKGTEPAAWAPYSGEALAVGGARMSDNLIDGLKAHPKNGTASESDGTWHHEARTQADGHDSWLVWELPGQTALATNKTYRVALSTMGTSANTASLCAGIGYTDAAGSTNWVFSPAFAIGTSWCHVEATVTVPSGMKPFGFCVAAFGTCPEVWMASPTLSLGSPVTLAVASHTPYATQGYVDAKKADEADLQSLSAKVTANTKSISKNANDISTLSALSTLYSDDKWRVCVKCGFVWVYCYNVSTGEGSWDFTDCPYTLPAEYSPHMSVRAPVVTANGGSYTGYVSVTSVGEISVSNFGGTGSTDARSGTLCYPIGI